MFKKLKKDRTFFYETSALIILFLMFCFVRFYNLDKRISFGWDQEQFSNQAYNIIRNHHFTLLGPRVNNDMGFFLAPYFIYLLIPFYLLTNLHPNALFIFVIIYNIFFYFSSYYLIKKIFSKEYALWFIFLWTINSVMQSYDTQPWNPIYIPIGLVLTFFLLKKIYEKPVMKHYWFMLGLILGFFCNMHFQFIFIIFYCIFFILLIYKKNYIKINYILLSVFGFFITLLPLFLFDFRHNFLNTKLFINFFLRGSSILPKHRFLWLEVFNNFIKPYIYVNSAYLTIVFYLLILGFLIFLLKNKNGFFTILYKSLVCLWVIFPIFFTIYGERPSEYYFVFLTPIILISTIDFFLTLKLRKILILITGLLFLINYSKYNIQIDSQGLYYQNEVIKKIQSNYKGKKLNIKFDGNNNYGFNYLMKLNNIKLSYNQGDVLINIGYPSINNSFKIGGFGINVLTDQNGIILNE